MASKVTKIQLKRGLEANLPTLSAGEPAFTTDQKNFYIGDGAINQRYLKTTGDTMTGQLFIDGSADAIQLKVQGHSSQTANLTEWQNSSGTGLVVVTNAGNVGIGTTAPTEELDLVGTFQAKAKSGSDNVWFRGINSAGTTVAQMQEASSVGYGGLLFNGQRNNNTQGNGIFFGGYVGTTASQNNAAIEFRGVGGTIATPADLPTGIPIAKFSSRTGGVTVDRVTIDNLGNVGIGTTSPGASLNVVAGAIGTVPGLIQGYSSGQTADLLQIAKNPGATPSFVFTSAGNLGIGTTSPTEELDLVGTFQAKAKSGSDNVWFRGINSAGATVAQMQEASSLGYGGLLFNGQRQDNTGGNGVYFGGYVGSTASGNNAAIEFRGVGGTIASPVALPATIPVAKFSQYNGSATVDLVTILQNGNVGIGTTAPAGKLHINGTADDQQLIVEAHSTQTNNIVEIHDSSSNVLAYISPTGGALFKDKVIFTQTDGNEYIDSLTDGYMDYRATTAHRFGDGTNQLVIDADGDLSLEGTAKYERHVQIDATPSGSAASQMSPVTIGTATGLQASSSVDQYAGFQWEVPDDWDGTDAYVEIDWLPDSAGMTGTDALRWVVEYRSIAEGETITNGTLVTVDNGAGGDTTDYPQYTTKHTRMTLDFDNANQPMTKQDHMYFLIHRDTGVTNDFAGTVVITAFEIIYNSTGFPSSN